jgi:hypothetical protein
MLFLSCYVNKSKTSAKLTENSLNKNRYNSFQWCPRLFPITVFYRRSTWTGYQKRFIRSMTK